METKIIGLEHLRKNIGMTADIFGKEILGGVSRATISKWERGHELIPKKKLKILSEIFECEPELLQGEVDAENKALLNVIALKFQSDTEANAQYEKFIQEQKFRKQELKADVIVDSLALDSELVELVEKIIELSGSRNDLYLRKRVRFVLALLELYKEGKDYNLVDGESDYEKGLIAKDDAIVQIMLNAMKLALEKREEK